MTNPFKFKKKRIVYLLLNRASISIFSKYTILKWNSSSRKHIKIRAQCYLFFFLLVLFLHEWLLLDNLMVDVREDNLNGKKTPL